MPRHAVLLPAFQAHEAFGELCQFAVEVALRVVVHGQDENAQPAAQVPDEEGGAQGFNSLHRHVVEQIAEVCVHREATLCVQLLQLHHALLHQLGVGVQPHRRIKLGQRLRCTQKEARVVDQQVLQIGRCEGSRQALRVFTPLGVDALRCGGDGLEKPLIGELGSRLAMQGFTGQAVMQGCISSASSRGWGRTAAAGSCGRTWTQIKLCELCRRALCWAQSTKLSTKLSGPRRTMLRPLVVRAANNSTATGNNCMKHHQFSLRRFTAIRRACAMAAVLACCGSTSMHSSAQTDARNSAPSRGELLYTTHCGACHSSQMHWRDKKQVLDWTSLRAQVRFWQSQAMLGWNDEDINQVARYLNNAYYRMPPPAEQTIPVMSGVRMPQPINRTLRQTAPPDRSFGLL